MQKQFKCIKICGRWEEKQTVVMKNQSAYMDISHSIRAGHTSTNMTKT